MDGSTCPGCELGLVARSPIMTRALVVNAGSSSLKLRLLDPRGEITAALDLDEWDGSPDTPGTHKFFNGASGVSAVGHRVAHGGSQFTRAAVIDDQVTSAIRDLTGLAAMHQPRALAGEPGAAPLCMPTPP
jgi:acetate kinase